MIDSLLRQLLYDPNQPLIFSSALFLLLFLGFSLVYATLGRWTTVRLAFVTLFSYYFYYKSSGFYFALLAVVTLSDFLLALLIERYRRLARLFLLVSLTVDLGFLAYFKYANFFGATLAHILGNNFQPWDIFLPVGISFFTFQSLSYIIDVYRGTLKPLHNPLDYAFYVSFFPQLVAGPIVRAADFIPQIRKPLFVSRLMFGQGVFLILGGLFKKAVISDYISVNFVERIFDDPTLYSGLECLMGVYGYALQIYCDFSGYSDMAIGLALLLGFRFPENFRAPYLADSITDFWHRWHISLSTWLRDYIYISLGGNRHGRCRMYVNLMLTMLLGGLWHGASLNFVLWGALHGLALALHKAYRQLRGLPRDHHDGGLLRFLSVLLTFHFVCALWVLFRCTAFDTAQAMFRQIATAFHPELALHFLQGYPAVCLLMLVGYTLHFLPERCTTATRSWIVHTPLPLQALFAVLLIYLVVQVKSSDIQPFIYFQF